MELVSIEDFKETKLDPTWGRFDYLLEIARVEEIKNSAEKKPIVKPTNDELVDIHREEQGKRRSWLDQHQGYLKYFLYNNTAPKPLALFFNNRHQGFNKKKMQNNVVINNADALVSRKRKLRELKDEDEEWRQVLPKSNESKKQRQCPESSVNPSVAAEVEVPDLPETFKEYILKNMGGSELCLVLQKAMSFSDINPQASRLTMPFSQVRTHQFLSAAEAEDLKSLKKTIRVLLLDPSMKEREINFGKWNYVRGSSSYIFKTKWNSLVKDNGVEKGDMLQVWSFRAKSDDFDSDLCFAMVKLPTP